MKFALQDALRNVFDPNTSAKATREVTLSIKIKPDKTRKTAVFDFDVKRKTAPPETLTQTCQLERNDKGQVVAYELGDQLSGQIEMPEVETTFAAGGEPDNVIKFTAAK